MTRRRVARCVEREARERQQVIPASFLELLGRSCIHFLVLGAIFTVLGAILLGSSEIKRWPPGAQCAEREAG